MGTDLENNSLSYVIVSLPPNGILTDPNNSNASVSEGDTIQGSTVTYSSTSDTATNDSFTFKVNDGKLDSNIASISIDITAVNDIPILSDDSVSTDEDTNVDINFNAVDPDNSQITYSVAINPTNGNVSITNNIATYTPNSNFNGNDSFTVTANDGQATSSPATISITVNAVNDAPVANNNSIILNEGAIVTTLQNGESTVLFNDTDVENSSLTVTLVSNTNNGTLTLNTDGTFSYEHDGSETTSDNFAYKVNDGNLDSNTATVNITVNPVNDNMPTEILITNNSIQENLSSGVIIGQLSVLDIDLPSDNHTYELVSGNGDDNNSSFNINGKNLIINTSLDFETQQNLSIRVKTTDQNNQSFEKPLTINVINVNDISITFNKTDSYCSGNSGTGAINITSVNQTIGNITYNWSATNGAVIPSGQENNQNLTALSNGTYNLSISDTYFTYNKSFEISLTSQYSDLSICYVSSDDSEPTKNRIYLNNQGNYNVAFYEILRESNIANVYTSIGTIASTENSFLDDNSDSMVQSYNYKVRLIDKCGNTSSNSDLHKTILLQSSISVSNSVNLNWSNYVGKSFSTYNIFRNSNQEGFQLIGSVSANNNSYNDATANVTDNNYEYYISVEVDACLTQSKSRESNNSKEIKSNRQSLGTSLSLNSFISLKQLSVYPNPTNSKLHIKLSNDLSLIKGEVYNAVGQIIMETNEAVFSVENLAPAMYFIKIFTSDGIAIRRFIKK